MKRVLALALAMVMALSLAACGGSGDTSTGDSGSSGGNVVRIGVFEPATGDSGPGGKQEMLGMQYANKETPTVDIGGTTYNVELVYADNGSTTDKAPTAAAELVSKDVSLVLGSYGSSVAMAGGPVFDEAGLAAIGVTCTNPNITAGNDYYFRICFLDNFQAQVLVNALLEGPQSKELVSALPEGFSILSIWTDEDICYVNLPSSVCDAASGDASRRTIRALVDSLCSLDTVDGVQIRVDGESRDRYGEVDISGILQPDQ